MHLSKKISAWPAENLINEITVLKLEMLVQDYISSHCNCEVEDAAEEFYRLLSFEWEFLLSDTSVFVGKSD